MLANTTAFGEEDVIAVMCHYFSKTSTFHSDFGTYFSDTFSTKQIIFANHAKTLFQASNSKTQIKTNQQSRRF